MKTILFYSKNRNYKVHIGFENISTIGREMSQLSDTHSQKAVILADSGLKKYCEQLKLSLIPHYQKVETIWIKGSEESKSYDFVHSIYKKMLNKGADRHSVIYALGGGVIGDIAGFVAGTYLRGIPWIGVPTTLLAQVDSSVGGKTGINLEFGKNLIGLFYQPEAVFCDLQFLRSLPKRELISGFGEVIKYALIFDQKFFSFLKRSWQGIFDFDQRILSQVVHQCLLWKKRVVKEDEFEKVGKRALLNFGHTLGHAIEAETHYSYYKHGEAVILGMRAASHISMKCGSLSKTAYHEIDSFLAQIPLPPIPKQLKVEKLLGRLKWDKKSFNGKVRFVLLRGIGEAYLESQVKAQQIGLSLENLAIRSMK